jgi:hypothetical protein
MGRPALGTFCFFVSLAALSAGCAEDSSPADNADGGPPAGDLGTPPREIVRLAPGTDPSAPTHFERPGVTDASRASAVLYPLDGVLFPRNVHPADVQWEGPGAQGDLYRVRFAGVLPELTAYVTHTGDAFKYDYAFDTDAWRQLAEASGGRPVTLTVDRWDRARDEVVRGPATQVRFARGSIAGAVYYWTLGEFRGTQGRILRVVQGADTPPRVENFMPSPPPRRDGGRCAACHGLSRDGNRLALSLGDGEFGGVYDATNDLSGPTPPAVFNLQRSWFYAAFNREGTRLYMTDAEQRAFVLDASNGNTVVNDGLPRGTHPAWSPDGSLLAFISSANDAWNLDRGDLSVMPALANDRFDSPRVLHRGADLASAPEGGPMDAYPTFSPDGRYLAFQHGTRVLLSASGATGALYAVPSGGGAPVRFTRASGGAGANGAGDAWYPNFTPFTTAGDTGDPVYWLLFYSRRDYGNRQAGTRETRRRQIWVTAVSTRITAESDPSNVPYWLPGQEVEQENASAFWAPRPCRPTGAECSTDAQCCGGNCDELTGSPHVCRPPAPSGCRRQGQSCGTSADCCDRSHECAGGVCLPVPG